MRDLVRKLDKFVKEKEKAKTIATKQGKFLSPHVTYVASPSTASTANKNKTLSRNFSMTVSFFNPKFEKQYPKDYSIRHEVGKQANIVASPERATSPKRDPIVQNNGEAVEEFRSRIKRLPESDKMALFSEEPSQTKIGLGEYNPIQHARSLSPKFEGKRTFTAPERALSPGTQQRRLRKEGKPFKNDFDPILEGDIKGVRPAEQRKHLRQTEASESTLRLNDRKSILPSELGQSAKGRVFRDTKLALSAIPTEDETPQRFMKRYASPQNHRRSEMEGLMRYDYSLQYRDQGVSPKCNSFKISDFRAAGN